MKTIENKNAQNVDYVTPEVKAYNIKISTSILSDGTEGSGNGEGGENGGWE